MSLWIILTVLAATAAGAALWPLLRPQGAAARRGEYDIEVYLDQLRELARDRERGLIDDEQEEAARLEIERRLLAAKRAAETDTGATPPVPRRALAALLALFMLGGALALYLGQGQPNLPNLPFASREAPAPDNGLVQRALARLPAIEARIAAAPGDADAWRDLGILRLAAGQVEDAVTALAEAMRLSNGRSDIASAYGEALTRAADGMVTAAARTAFATAIAGDAADARAQYFLALGDYQAGRRQAALDRWAELARTATPGAPWLATVLARIERAASELGVDAAAYLPEMHPNAPRGPSEEDIAAAREMSPEAQDEMIRGMVAQLAARLEDEPGDVAGWRRLGQSYTVLDEPARAAEAYARALALEPDHTETLLRGALAAAAAGDTETARDRFTRLRGSLPDDSEAARLVDEALTRMDSPGRGNP